MEKVYKIYMFVNKSDVTKQKIGKAHRGKKMTLEQRKRLSETRKNTPLTERQLMALQKARENTRWAKKKKLLQKE